MNCKQCVDCKHFNNKERNDEFCEQGMWYRDEDSFIADQEDYEKYINTERFCSEFETL